MESEGQSLSPAEFDGLVARFLDELTTPEEEEHLMVHFSQSESSRDAYVSLCVLSSLLNETLESGPMTGDCRPPASPVSRAGSAVLGFLSSFTHGGTETPAANALMWMVMGVVCSGIAMTIVFCTLLLFQWTGLNAHVNRAGGPGQVAVRGKVESGQLESGQVGRGDSDILSPPSAALSPAPASPSSIATVARLVHTYDSHWVIGSHSPRIGDDLAPGRKLALLSGAAEIIFQSGVRAILQGPATMEIVARDSAILQRGKLAIRVEDPDARGFVVCTPGMKYTDLGTEFGVWVAKDGTQEMHVFQGKVRAEEEGERRKAKGESASSTVPPSVFRPSPSALVVTANQAIRVDRAENNPQQIRCNENRFFRATFTPVSFAIFGTGVGLDRGADDPHWQLTEISTDSGFKPRLALVAVPPGIYIADSRATGQWIAKSKEIENEDMPDGCRMTFRTHFDLTGFVAHTARIEGRISADDYVAAIRLNGKDLPVPAGSRGRLVFNTWLPLVIDSGFVDGDNALDIVIENAVLPPHTDANKMALCVALQGTARPWPVVMSQD